MQQNIDYKNRRSEAELVIVNVKREVVLIFLRRFIQGALGPARLDLFI